MTDTTTEAHHGGLPAIEQALDDWLEGAWTELEGEPVNQDQADKLLHALQAVRRRLNDVHMLASNRIAEINTWRMQQADQLAAQVTHLDKLLAGWTRAQYERTGRKTFKLTGGDLKARALRPRTVTDPSMKPEEIAAAVKPMTGPGMLPAEAIKTTHSVVLSEVKANTTPGDVIEGYEAPEGYEARQAVGTFDFGGPEPVQRVIPGVVLLIPKPGTDGMQFTAVPS